MHTSTLQVLGSEGRLNIGDDGTAQIEGDKVLTDVDVPEWEVEGIEAGVHELVKILDAKGESSCTVYDGREVVKMMLGILQSQQEGNSRVAL